MQPITENVMKPGYYLIDEDGKYHGPIVADNPEHDTYNHPSILQKVQKWAKLLGQRWEYVSE